MTDVKIAALQHHIARNDNERRSIMFTGIITAISRVKKATISNDGMVLEVEKPSSWDALEGQSIAVNGVCSTVKKDGATLEFDYMPETLSRSNLGELKEDDIVNLEQSLLATGRLEGHIVQGHVDCVGTIKSIVPEGNSFIYTITVPEAKQMALVAEKGSIAVDGISLTVAEVGKDFFTVKIIPYTQEHTNLKQKQAGTTVNLEFDVLAKYLQQMLRISTNSHSE